MRRQTKATILSFLAAWAFLLAPLAPRLAHAQTGNADIDKGIALYNDLEFAEAVEVLAKAVTKANLSVQELVEGYKYLALACVALGRDDEARTAFRKLLETDRTYRLPRTESQKAQDLFDQVRQSMPEEILVRPVQLTQTASPVRPRRGTPVSVTIAIVDEDKRHDRVVVYHRVRGAKPFSTVQALRAGSGRYNATIPGVFVNPPAVEYYVVALTASGDVLASEGSEKSPQALGVDTEEAAPIYGKWWFWAGIGGVLAAGTITAIALAGGGSTPSNNLADVDLTVGAPEQ